MQFSVKWEFLISASAPPFFVVRAFKQIGIFHWKHIPVVVILAVEFSVPPVARVGQHDAASGARYALLVPQTFANAEQVAVVDAKAASFAWPFTIHAAMPRLDRWSSQRARWHHFCKTNNCKKHEIFAKNKFYCFYFLLLWPMF